MRWLGVKSSTIPTARELLRLVYVGRMCLAIAIYITTALKVRVAAPPDILASSLMLVTTVAVTIASYWHTHFRGRLPGPTFLYLQAVFDVLLITAVVHMTGGADSDLASLYVVLIAVTALLMPPANAGLVTLFAGLVYFADVFWGHSSAVTPGVWIQLGVFILVAVVTAYVSSRVNVMGAEREALAAEVRQVQLEAGDVPRNIRTGVITVDADGRLLYANPASEEILGFKAREWLGRTVMPEFARLAPEFWAAVTSTSRRGVRLMRVEATVHRPDRSFPIGVTTTTLDGPVGARPRVSAIFTDISDSKRLEQLHLRAERLEAVAQLSSSLAHEIKNPLASIRSSVEQLGKSSRANPDEKFLANLIVREGEGRLRLTECRPMDLHAVAEAAIRLVRQHPDCGKSVKIALEGQATPMEGDEDLLHRVVSNLVLNAVQAGGAKAHVVVRTGRAAPNELPAAAGIDNPIALRVIDDGPGIPEELRTRLVEPFATGRVGGTGLGLAIVQRAVEAHRGLVLVDTKAGGGTTFTVYFPAARRKEEAA